MRPDAVLALDHLLMGCRIVGFDWTYRFVNPAAAQHSGTSTHQLIGRTVYDAHPGIEHAIALITPLRQAMYDRTSHVFEHQFEFADGRQRWFSYRVEPVPEGIRIYSLDIQYRKDIEATLAHRAAAAGWNDVWRRLWRRSNTTLAEMAHTRR